MQYLKYPKMKHLPWSKSVSRDDKKLDDVSAFEAMDEVVVMEKLDGECTTMYTDHIHARSTNSKNHPSRSFVKSIHGAIKNVIATNVALVGENMFAKHSIYYDQLSAYFYLFAVYMEDRDDPMNYDVLSWDETEFFAYDLGLETCPVIYQGPWDEVEIKKCWLEKSHFGFMSEGYVVRNAETFSYDDFSQNIAKFVRENHVQTDKNWFFQKVIPNQLAKEL